MTYMVREVPSGRVRVVCEECGDWDGISAYMSCEWDEQRQQWVGDGDFDAVYCCHCGDHVEIQEEPI